MKLKSKFLITTLICWFGIVDSHAQEIWSLGRADNSSEEFALSPDGCRNFIPNGFGQDDHIFRCKNQDSSEFPYILPGPTAEWAGYSYWAGPCFIQLKMLMNLGGVVEDETYRLCAHLLDIGHEEGIYLRLGVNGHAIDFPLEKESRKVVFDIEGGLLRNGGNILFLQLFNGKSVVFDALTLYGPSETRLLTIDDEVIEAMREPSKRKRESIDYVNQFAGSSGSRWMIGPGPWMPFGMVKIMPDNEDSHWKAGYEYGVENIMGFSHIHEWTMTGLLTMPTNGPLQVHPGSERNPDAGYRSRIDKSGEEARIGYYGVELTDYGIYAELTATTRASLQRYTFNRSDDARILVDFHFPAEYSWTLQDLEIRKVSDHEIEGWTRNDCRSTGYKGVQNYRLHFVMQFDRPFESMNGWIRDSLFREIDNMTPQLCGISGNDVGDAGLWMDFNLENGDQVCVRTGISLVSVENARMNLEEEMAKPFGWDFNAVVDNQRKTWQELFDRVEISTPDEELKEKFYTNLYRAISPRTIWNDVDGSWRDMNGNIAKAENGRNVFGGDSAWGMHWTLGPFYNMLYPEFMSDWIYTYESFYRLGGWLPVGNPGMRYFRVMVGNPVLPLIVSGYQHGIRDFDKDLMAEAIYHQQTAVMENYPDGAQVGNESYPDYIVKGYVPLYNDSWWGESPHYQSYVSNTMEYAYQDWCAAQYFASVGRDEDYMNFMKRSENWRNIFDPETKYVRPRLPDGSWIENKDPRHAPGFCEGSAWQFTWYVPHAPEDLVSEMGEDVFIERLNEGFETSERVNFNALGDNMGAYPINHGNETNMQAAYLFNFTSEPWHTQRWVRAILDKYYGTGPRSAYPGDEDQGQMSSWYVMSSLGFFAMDGGCGEDPVWTLGAPLFEKAVIRLDKKYHSGRKLIIKAKGVSEENCYVQAVYFNGEKLVRPFIEWSRLREGGTLRYEMGPEPCPDAFKTNK